MWSPPECLYNDAYFVGTRRNLFSINLTSHFSHTHTICSSRLQPSSLPPRPWLLPSFKPRLCWLNVLHLHSTVHLHLSGPTVRFLSAENSPRRDQANWAFELLQTRRLARKSNASLPTSLVDLTLPSSPTSVENSATRPRSTTPTNSPSETLKRTNQ